jgi:aquaporin Z
MSLTQQTSDWQKSAEVRSATAASGPNLSPVPAETAGSAILRWPEYAMEAALLGIFMFTACLITVVLQHPLSPVRETIPSEFLRRLLTGLAMGATAVALIYSPWGERSGAHFNPSVTLTFLHLGRIRQIDALFYILFQFAGGAAGVYVATLLLGARLSDPAVHYAATYPGHAGLLAAALGELIISFLLMTVVLSVSASRRLSHITGVFAGLLVTTYITFESPYSGMSMNPARTAASALSSGIWQAYLIYLIVPPLAMLAASEVFVRLAGRESIHCCKLYHSAKKRCIFCGKEGNSHA